MGVAPERLKRIAERFQQGGSALSGKPRGLGLGLSLCRTIVTHYGGRIWAESEPGHGSTCFVALPTTPMENGARSPGPAHSAARLVDVGM